MVLMIAWQPVGARYKDESREEEALVRHREMLVQFFTCGERGLMRCLMQVPQVLDMCL